MQLNMQSSAEIVLKTYNYTKMVIFLLSFRSTLQNYLKRHEGNDVNKGNASSSNPFEKGQKSAGPEQALCVVKTHLFILTVVTVII